MKGVTLSEKLRNAERSIAILASRLENAGLSTDVHGNEMSSNKELAKLIIKMSKLNPQSKSLLGKNGLDYCEKEFNKKLLINKLKVLMNNLK